MSKRKKKRGGGRSPYEGYETEVWGSSPIQIAAIEKEYRSMEEESFPNGRRGSGAEPPEAGLLRICVRLCRPSVAARDHYGDRTGELCDIS